MKKALGPFCLLSEAQKLAGRALPSMYLQCSSHWDSNCQDPSLCTPLLLYGWLWPPAATTTRISRHLPSFLDSFLPPSSLPPSLSPLTLLLWSSSIIYSTKQSRSSDSQIMTCMIMLIQNLQDNKECKINRESPPPKKKPTTTTTTTTTTPISRCYSILFYYNEEMNERTKPKLH